MTSKQMKRNDSTILSLALTKTIGLNSLTLMQLSVSILRKETKVTNIILITYIIGYDILGTAYIIEYDILSTTFLGTTFTTTQDFFSQPILIKFV